MRATVSLIGVFTLLASTARAEEVIRMDSVRIEGEMQKPQVAYIIPRASQIDLSGDLQRLRPQQTARYLQMVRSREATFGRQAVANR